MHISSIMFILVVCILKCVHYYMHTLFLQNALLNLIPVKQNLDARSAFFLTVSFGKCEKATALKSNGLLNHAGLGSSAALRICPKVVCSTNVYSRMNLFFFKALKNALLFSLLQHCACHSNIHGRIVCFLSYEE